MLFFSTLSKQPQTLRTGVVLLEHLHKAQEMRRF